MDHGEVWWYRWIMVKYGGADSETRLKVIHSVVKCISTFIFLKKRKAILLLLSMQS